MDIIPQVYNYDKYIMKVDSQRIANLEELDKIHENTILIYNITADNAKRNINRNINIRDEFKHFHIHIQINSNVDFSISKTPPLDELFIKCDDANISNLEDKVNKILEQVHEDTIYLNLSSLKDKIKVGKSLPKGLKSYITIRTFNDDLENLPNTLEYLCLFLNNEVSIADTYNFNFLPLTLETLSIHLPTRGDCVIPELNNLPVNLKYLELDNYTHTLATLPSGLETLIIHNYYYIADEHPLPPNLKILQIVNCNNLNIREYPVKLENLDINIKVDLEKLPSTVKGIGLYNFNLEANTPKLPLNITTIYTNDEEIKQLPAHIKRVIVIIKRKDWGNIMTARIGDVSFEMDTYNTDQVFWI
jgi:hypothetical protein